MGISMHCADICVLNFVEHLRKTINKSEAKWVSFAANHLSFNLQKLGKLISRARELSLRNYRRPYILSHTPKQRRTGKTKEYVYQVSPGRLSDMFTKARNATGLYIGLPKN
ncbi:hypothetical protein ACJJIB_05545 [Microbulbifer sp. JMSA008]